jgi:hypothetical protein
VAARSRVPRSAAPNGHKLKSRPAPLRCTNATQRRSGCLECPLLVPATIGQPYFHCAAVRGTVALYVQDDAAGVSGSEREIPIVRWRNDPVLVCAVGRWDEIHGGTRASEVVDVQGLIGIQIEDGVLPIADRGDHPPLVRTA